MRRVIAASVNRIERRGDRSPRSVQRLLLVPGAVVDEPEVELPGLVLLEDEDASDPGGVLLAAPEPIVSEELDAPPRLDPEVLSVSLDDEPTEPELEPELIVPGPLEVPGRVELAPEPAPEPMLPEVVSPDEDDDERPVDDLLALCHFWNSDCDSAPSLFVSAVVKPELSSVCIAASVCEMRPSLFASSDLNVAVVPEPDPELELEAPEPAPIEPLLLLWLGELPLWP